MLLQLLPVVTFRTPPAWNPKSQKDCIFRICIHTVDQDQVSISPSAPWEASVLPELALGHLCYCLTGVQPQTAFHHLNTGNYLQTVGSVRKSGLSISKTLCLDLYTELFCFLSSFGWTVVTIKHQSVQILVKRFKCTKTRCTSPISDRCR